MSVKPNLVPVHNLIAQLLNMAQGGLTPADLLKEAKAIHRAIYVRVESEWGLIPVLDYEGDHCAETFNMTEDQFRDVGAVAYVGARSWEDVPDLYMLIRADGAATTESGQVDALAAGGQPTLVDAEKLVDLILYRDHIQKVLTPEQLEEYSDDLEDFEDSDYYHTVIVGFGKESKEYQLFGLTRTRTVKYQQGVDEALVDQLTELFPNQMAIVQQQG